MFRVIATGRNKNYGKFKEKRLIADNFIRCALKRGWIFPNIKYVGDGRTLISTLCAFRIADEIKKEAKQ
jgi:hypothetical protein